MIVQDNSWLSDISVGRISKTILHIFLLCCTYEAFFVMSLFEHVISNRTFHLVVFVSLLLFLSRSNVLILIRRDCFHFPHIFRYNLCDKKTQTLQLLVSCRVLRHAVPEWWGGGRGGGIHYKSVDPGTSTLFSRHD